MSTAFGRVDGATLDKLVEVVLHDFKELLASFDLWLAFSVNICLRKPHAHIPCLDNLSLIELNELITYVLLNLLTHLLMA